MISVDLSFMSVHKALGPGYSFAFFCAEEEYEIKNDHYAIHYQHLQSQEQLRVFDVIIYWGDFLHWVGYKKWDWLSRFKIRQPELSEEAVFDLWYKLFLLEGVPELQAKTIIFGGTLYALNAKQLTNKRYLAALTALYRNARLALLRDQVSASFISQLVPTNQDFFGCDCALLLNKGEAPPPRTAPEKYILCSFGRSGANVAITSFATQIAPRMGLKLLGMNWLGHPAGMEGLQEKLRLVREAELVVTDIYHLAVNSWREGVPALCFGKGNGNPTGTISDKKKEIFYRQMFGSAWYLYLSDLLEHMRANAEFDTYCRDCLETITDLPQRDFIISALNKQRDKSFARLLAAIAN